MLKGVESDRKKVDENTRVLESAGSPSAQKKPDQLVPRRNEAINFLPQIRNFTLRSSASLNVLDAVGWLFLQVLTVVIVILKFASLSKNKVKKPIEPPGPEGHALLGVYPEFAERGILDFSDQVWKTYGQETSICQFKLGSRHVYLVTDPAFCEKILADNETFERGSSFAVFRHFLGNTSLTTEGVVWRQKSRELFPHLAPKKLNQYHERLVAVGRAACERWSVQAQKKQTIDLLEEMSLITVDVIGRTLLNMDLHKEMGSTGKALNKVLSYIIENFVSAIPPWLLEKIPTKSTREYQQALDILKLELNEAIKKYVKEKKNSTGEYYIDERIAAYRGELDKGIVSRPLVDEIMLVFFAGHDTTSKLLTWTLFELAQNPEVSRKLYEEIDLVLEGREPTFDDLKDLPYLAKVLQESLRVYPPVSGIVRDVSKDTQLGPYHIPRGSSVQIGIRLMGKDPKIWKKPEEFDPDRFEGELTNKVTQHIFTPFITGKHRCPGQYFALNEAKIILIVLMQQFAFRLDDHQAPIHAITKVTLQPDKPINLTVMARPSPARLLAAKDGFSPRGRDSKERTEREALETGGAAAAASNASFIGLGGLKASNTATGQLRAGVEKEKDSDAAMASRGSNPTNPAEQQRSSF